jgi:hypothetical protein
MNLHEHLRELVAQQGPSVVETAEAFRAALDDFLSEDEATTGELNLLVDAVRLGAIVRLGSILDHGADPRAAVAEAGDTFARDRGTDDVLRCRWAVAVVGYGLGRVEAADVPPSSIPAPRSSQPPPPPPPPPTSRPEAPPTAATPRTFPSTEDLAPPASVPTPVAGPPRRRGGRVVLVALLVAAVVAGAVLAGMWLGSRDDDPNEATDDPTVGQPTDESPTGDDTGSSAGPSEGTISEETVLVPVTDDQDVTRIWAVDVDAVDAEWEPVTAGPDDRVPVVSPDRATLIYSEVTENGAFRPMVRDVESGDTRRLFATPGGCDYSARPGFNPAGTRVAVVCTDEFGGYSAMYVVTLRGAYKANVPATAEPLGSATWTSDTTLAWAQAGATPDAPTTLWEAEAGATEARQLTDGSEGWDTHPDWSDEAGLLLFSRHAGSEPFGELLTMDAEGNPGPGTDGVLWGHPAWSPDGTRVVFMVKDGGTERLAVAPIDDLTDVTYLPDLPGDPGVPAWGSR